MSFKEDGFVWMNGKMVPWKDATIHVASHVVHYGSSVFEGIRAYENKKGSAVFRLDAHIERLFNSAKIYRMEIPFTFEEICNACIETIKANGMKSCYIRPVVYRGYAKLGVDPFPNPVDVSILVWDWGKYLGDEALEQGVDVHVSSWRRMAPDTFPSMAKSGGNYMNGQLIKMEAIVNGYVEGIALDAYGYISEGSGENIFLVKKGILYTPPISSCILPGITRESVIQIAKEKGIEVREEDILREALYIADEIFFVGTAAEITPIRSVDKIVIGKGRRGEITKLLQDEFFGIIKGEKEDKWNWLKYF